jgi:hypothetical protein
MANYVTLYLGASPTVVRSVSTGTAHARDLLLAVADRKAGDATKRAIKAFCLTGAGLTQKQAAQIEDAGLGYVSLVASLTPAARLQAARGDLPLSRIWHERYGHPRLEKLTDADLDAIVKAMPERYSAALDRFTAPAISVPVASNGHSPDVASATVDAAA